MPIAPPATPSKQVRYRAAHQRRGLCLQCPARAESGDLCRSCREKVRANNRSFKGVKAWKPGGQGRPPLEILARIAAVTSHRPSRPRKPMPPPTTLRLFHQLAFQARFHLPEMPAPHFLKTGDGAAEVVPTHRRHSAAPPGGAIALHPDAPVHTFETWPLHQRVNQGITNIRTAMVELARTFPSVAGFWPDGTAWDADVLCLAARKFSSGEAAAARFLLAVWKPGMKWRCGQFNFVAELSAMDPGDRQALAAWVLHPWWP